MEVATSPDQMVATAPFLAECARCVGIRDVEIHILALTSLNGRKPQLQIDRDLNLLTMERTIGPQLGITPLRELLRHEPWDVPSDDRPDVLGIQVRVTEEVPQPPP